MPRPKNKILWINAKEQELVQKILSENYIKCDLTTKKKITHFLKKIEL